MDDIKPYKTGPDTWVFEIDGIPVPIYARTKTQALMALRYMEALQKEKGENARQEDRMCDREISLPSKEVVD